MNISCKTLGDLAKIPMKEYNLHILEASMFMKSHK